MIFNFRPLLIKICVFVIGFFIIVQVAMIAFAPVIPDPTTINNSPGKDETTIIGNGVNSGSSPTTRRIIEQPNDPPTPFLTSSSGNSAEEEIFPAFIAVFLIAGVLYYISRPKTKEWFLYEI